MWLTCYGLKPELGFRTPRQMEAQANTTREQSKKKRKLATLAWRSRKKNLHYFPLKKHFISRARVFLLQKIFFTLYQNHEVKLVLLVTQFPKISRSFLWDKQVTIRVLDCHITLYPLTPKLKHVFHTDTASNI